ncbi:helix-turn-helix domain-containing protein [Aquimarina sp. RZ0]|nr:helix-turn-helix domain-containing protein [Aquimarina sp. RZ0]
MKFEKSFYIRNFNEHVRENLFIEKPHGHNFYLILLVTKGSGTHTIDFLEYKVFPGAMFIVSPGQIHQWRLSNDVDGCILFFTKEFFLHDFDTEKLTRFPFFNSTFSSPMFQLNSKEKNQILAKYELIHEEYQSRSLSYQEMIRIYLNAMFIQLSRVYLTKNEKGQKFSYDLLQLNRYEALVDKYFKLHRPISCYSKKMNITDRQLSYLCKKTVGKTPSEIMMNRIMLEAKRLIVHSVLSISAISEELNYNDSSYFIRLFKKITKQTPEQFRNEQYSRY